MSTWLPADWPTPPQINAFFTTRDGGASNAPFTSFNLGLHVGDAEDTVMENRKRLREKLPNEPIWLNQVHGTQVVDAFTTDKIISADASFTNQKSTVCCVMMADCLPVFVCNKKGSQVGIAHAGWRGLLDGVMEALLDRMQIKAEDTLVYFGPAIGPSAFEVGSEVREQFITNNPQATIAFKTIENSPGKWLADIYTLARLRLEKRGIGAIFGGDFCTFSDSNRFFSYRRDGRTGRMASVIWLE